jgi:hypothetical protein
MNEFDVRVLVMRQFLMDAETYIGGDLALSGAIHYLSWNFEKYVRGYMDVSDGPRKVKRILKAQAEIGEGNEMSSLDSPVIELHIGRMGKIIHDPANFTRWIFQKLIGPIIAEENRFLDHSSERVVWTTGGMRGHVSRGPSTFRFKAWEPVLFPFAQNVPPRVEPVSTE